MARINIETSIKYINDKNTIILVLTRYLILPCLFLISFTYIDSQFNYIIATIILFISTPTAIIALTISRSIGGFIMPTLSYTILASIISIIPFTLTLNFLFKDDILFVLYISFFVTAISLLLPYLFVFQARRFKPIKTAKFGERQAYISIILISIFIILVAMNLPPVDLVQLLIAVAIAIGLRVIAGLFSLGSHINSLDTYISMSYPNIFLIIVIANMMGHTVIQEIAILFLLPMFLLSVFDNWYSKLFHVNTKDNRLHCLLDIPK